MSNYVNPQSECILLNVPLQNDYKNQLTFSSVAEQTAYFLAKSIGKHFTNLTFIKDGEIAVESQIYDVYNANYIMFKNTGFANKWFYAFITEVKYVNENTSIIRYEIDCFQSWYFNLNYKDSFIIREHVTDDTIGAHTLDEGLGYGDYIITNIQDIQYFDEHWIYFVLVTETLFQIMNENQGTILSANKYDNIYTGCDYYLCSTPEQVRDIMKAYSKLGKADAIVDIYCVPPEFVLAEDILSAEYTLSDNTTITVHYLKQNAKACPLEITIDNRNWQDMTYNYTPKNKKLMCYPYKAVELTNNKGDTAVYKPELFKDYNVYKFAIKGSMINNVSAMCYPINYANSSDFQGNNFNADLGISLNGFPHCPAVTDFYKNWYAQNSVGNSVSLGIGIASSVASVATGNPIGFIYGATNLANTVNNYLNADYKAQVTPNQAKGNSSNVNPLVANNQLGFFLNFKSIKPEYAKIIDDYFSQFGYKVNKVGTPNLRSRTNWNFIKTEGANITGNIPQDHLNRIKKMFDDGVTLWHNDNVGNYNRSNPVR